MSQLAQQLRREARLALGEQQRGRARARVGGARIDPDRGAVLLERAIEVPEVLGRARRVVARPRIVGPEPERPRRTPRARARDRPAPAPRARGSGAGARARSGPRRPPSARSSCAASTSASAYSNQICGGTLAWSRARARARAPSPPRRRPAPRADRRKLAEIAASARSEPGVLVSVASRSSASPSAAAPARRSRVGERSPVRLARRSLCERGAQHLDRALALAVLVVELGAPVHTTSGDAGILLEAALPAARCARSSSPLSSANIAASRSASARVFSGESTSSMRRPSSSSAARASSIRSSSSSARMRGSNASIASGSSSSTRSASASACVGILPPVRVRLRARQQRRDVVGLLLEHAPRDLDRLVVVRGGERRRRRAGARRDAATRDPPSPCAATRSRGCCARWPRARARRGSSPRDRRAAPRAARAAARSMPSRSPLAWRWRIASSGSRLARSAASSAAASAQARRDAGRRRVGEYRQRTERASHSTAHARHARRSAC